MSQLQQVFFRGRGYGHVYTTAPPTSGDGVIKIDRLSLGPLAQLAADVLGEEQPLLPEYGAANLARWVIRFGCTSFGERPFLRAVARALIWRNHETGHCVCNPTE